MDNGEILKEQLLELRKKLDAGKTINDCIGDVEREMEELMLMVEIADDGTDHTL